MTIILIASINQNRVLSSNGKIPWTLPDDLKRFQSITTGHAIVMGRKTFRAIGKILPNRRNIVVSSSMQKEDGIELYQSIDDALNALSNEEKIFVIGGGEIFRQTFDKAEELLLTIVDDSQQGDVFFPPYQHLIGTMFELRSVHPMNGFRYEHYVRMVGNTPTIS